MPWGCWCDVDGIGVVAIGDEVPVGEASAELGETPQAGVEMRSLGHGQPSNG
jgi:hypothetical protein